MADPNPIATRADIAVLEQDRDAAAPALHAGNGAPDPRALAVAATLGEAKGVLEIDGTDIPKDGTESVEGRVSIVANWASTPTARWPCSRPWWIGVCI